MASTHFIGNTEFYRQLLSVGLLEIMQWTIKKLFFLTFVVPKPEISLPKCCQTAHTINKVNTSPMSCDKSTNYKESHSCIDLAPLQRLCQPSAHRGCNIIYSEVWKYEWKRINISICVRDCTFYYKRESLNATAQGQILRCPQPKLHNAPIVRALAHFGRGRRRNSHSLNQVVKNKNQEYSVKGGIPHTKALTSWLRSNCISWGSRRGKFSRKRGEAGEAVGGGLHGITADPSPSKGNMNADTSSTGQENSRRSSCFIHLLFFLTMKLNVLFPRLYPA